MCTSTLVSCSSGLRVRTHSPGLSTWKGSSHSYLYRKVSRAGSTPHTVRDAFGPQYSHSFEGLCSPVRERISPLPYTTECSLRRPLQSLDFSVLCVTSLNSHFLLQGKRLFHANKTLNPLFYSKDTPQIQHERPPEFSLSV